MAAPFGSPGASPELELLTWRRAVASIYAGVRGAPDPVTAHAAWRAARDELFATHPASPLAEDDPLRRAGIPYWPYDPALRFEVPLEPVAGGPVRQVATDAGEVTTLRLVGWVELPEPLGARLGVWSLAQYAGGLFVPLRDGTAGSTTYGGGRYVLDTAKGADLGGDRRSLVLDVNFAYHPSCRYDARWSCPLAPPENGVTVPAEAGERLSW